MTDPFTTALEQIDAERNRLSSARYVVENAVRFRDQAVRLGFEPETMANHTGFGMWVPFHDELIAALAAGGVVPPGPEVVEQPTPAREPMPSSDLNDAGKPWPAVRDDYQPPVEVEPAPECAHATTARVHSTGQTECVSCRDPVAEEKPRALPPIKDPRGMPVQPIVKREGWTADDEADLIERVNRGQSSAQIAAETNRGPKSVAGKITYMRSRGLLVDQQPVKPAPQPKPVTTTPAKPAAPLARPAPAQVTTEPANDEADDEAEFWTAARKRDLVSNILKGMKLADAADLTGCSDDEARAMWRSLCPNPTIDNQRKLMTRLNAEAAAEAEEVAA